MQRRRHVRGDLGSSALSSLLLTVRASSTTRGALVAASLTSKHVELRGLRLQRMPPTSLGFGERRGVTLHPLPKKKKSRNKKKQRQKNGPQEEGRGGTRRVEGSKPKPQIYFEFGTKNTTLPQTQPFLHFFFFAFFVSFMFFFFFLIFLICSFFLVWGLRREVTSTFSPTLSLLLSPLLPSLPRPRK